MSDTHITSILQEERQFQPTPEFSAQAHIKSIEEYENLYNSSLVDIEKFWAEQAENLTWFKKWDKVLEWNHPFAKWFVGGEINVSYNCLDRHLTTWRKNKAAIIWEGEPGDTKTLTYQQLHQEVCKFANVLKSQGINKGDRIAIYLPMVPELAISLLACARIGAIHTVIFGGFSAESIKDRLNDSTAKLVITADGGYRRGQAFCLKDKVDEAVAGVKCVEKVIVVNRTGQDIEWNDKIDRWYHELMKDASTVNEAEKLDPEHPLFLLYTSGTTGKPKGIQHSTGGYLLGASYSHKLVFDIKDEDTYWCTADIGWITGHSYIVYGPLANGATSLMYEGVPNHPDNDRFWEIIAKHRVNIFYTAPTAIRTFIKWGDEYPNRHDLSSLRLLGTVGEPINPEAWMWYHRVIGKEKCPIVDTWWQTETGMIMISPLPGATSTVPGSCTRPLPGIDAAIVDKDGVEAPSNAGGFLVIRKPWPSMLRTIWGDDERFKDTYWKRFEKNGFYFAGDGARKDQNGFFWIMGRVDDVINISGHRLGTMEVESALVAHPSVAEAAVVGKPHEIKGQAISAFVILEGKREGDKSLADELRSHVAKEIGAIAKPDDIRFTPQLPKTRSGKIMRRLLKNIAAGEDIAGDMTTLDDPSIIQRLTMPPL